MENTYIQAIEKTPTYEADILKRSVDRIFESLEIEKDLFEGIRVLLKPNLLGDYNAFFSVTTHPAVVRVVSEWLAEHGVKDILVADSPGGSVCVMPGFSFSEFYQKAGYAFLSDVPGVTLNTDGSWRAVPTPEGCVLKSYNILNAVCNADYIINLPKLKTHNKTGISFGVKNLFGCVPDIQKPAFHAKYPRSGDFANMLVELAMTVKPSLTVIDAVEILEHNGPVAGEKRNLGFLFGAKDVFSQDAYIAGLLGLDISQLDLLRIAGEKKLVHKAEVRSETFSSEERIAPLVLPDNITAATVFGKISSLFHMTEDKIKEAFLVATPVVNPDKCKSCKRCIMSCPVSAISEKNGFPEIDRSKCISCLCCSEVCIHDAIRVVNKQKRRNRTK